MHAKQLRRLATAIVLGFMVWGEPAIGAGAPNAPAVQALVLGRHLLAKATPDEDFNGIGEPYLPGPPFEHQPKVNQSYAWGMTKAGDKIWIGTGANTMCTLMGGYSDGLLNDTLETDSFVCEFAESRYDPTLPAGMEDWRPPQAFLYDLGTHTGSAVPIPSTLVTSTFGLRSAGNHNGVVILGGPQFGADTEITGINLFAFDADSGAFLDAVNLPQYANIRKWLVVDDVLYTTVGNNGEGGEVLRWTGDAQTPFQFEVVGHLDSEGAELALHEGRLFVFTWSKTSEGEFQNDEEAEIYASPVLPPGGLTAADADSWTKVWTVSDYEPDPVTASVWLAGGIASFDGYLYWGTINFPGTGAMAHVRAYERNTPLQILTALQRTHRSTTLFRGRNFGTPSEEIELLYGDEELYVYTETDGWQLQPNAMGVAPLYGEAGYGNFYNAYTWSMAIYDGQLYLGTFDWSYVRGDGLGGLLANFLGLPFEIDITPLLPDPGHYGADLYRIPDSSSPAETVSLDGVGNYANYGIRNMIGDEDGLFIGTANPMNLMTDPDDDKPEGGWELVELVPLTNQVFLPFVMR